MEAGFEYVCDVDGVKVFRKRSSISQSVDGLLNGAGGGIRTHEPLRDSLLVIESLSVVFDIFLFSHLGTVMFSGSVNETFELGRILRFVNDTSYEVI